MHLACSEGHVVVQILLGCNATIECRYCVGSTPLDMAITRGRTDIVDLLRNHESKNKAHMRVFHRPRFFQTSRPWFGARV